MTTHASNRDPLTRGGAVPRTIFPGTGEMAALCRELDWAATPLGDPAEWPQSLRTLVATLLMSPSPMLLMWGPQLIQVYNDAFRPSLGNPGRHPGALGMPGRDCWTDAWPLIGGQIDAAASRGESTWKQDQLVPIWRNGRMEDVWWTYGYSPVYDDEGSVAGVLVVCLETTRRVLTQARLEAIYNGTFEFIGLLAADGTVLDCNRAALEFVDRTRDDVVGQPFWEGPWFALTAGAPAQVRDAVERAAQGEFVRFEATLGHTSGRSVTFDISLQPVRDESGRVIFIVPEGRDVTAIRAGERERLQLMNALELERSRLSDAFRLAPSFLAVLRGPQYVFELVNDAYYALVGHRDLVGKPMLGALPELRDQGFVEILDRVVATGEPFVGRESRVLVARTPGAEREERFVDFVYQPLVEADGRRTGIIAHGSDVTEQVLARRAIERLLAESEAARADAEEARTEAEAANRAKSEFLAIMSHELRTPLNAIGGYAELLEMGIRGAITDAQREDVRRILASQRHLLGLINEVLNFAKLETGAVHYETGTVPVREVLGAAESLVAPQARAKGLSLNVQACEPTLCAHSDGEKMRQIVVNLLSNAVKFTPQGGRIDVSAEREDGRVVVRVRDTGIGIPADKIEAIFDPFVQVRSDLTRPHEGTGLGLAISRDLARGMDGDLVAESSPGAGSTFTLSLPAA